MTYLVVLALSYLNEDCHHVFVDDFHLIIKHVPPDKFIYVDQSMVAAVKTHEDACEILVCKSDFTHDTSEVLEVYTAAVVSVEFLKQKPDHISVIHDVWET